MRRVFWLLLAVVAAALLPSGAPAFAQAAPAAEAIDSIVLTFTPSFGPREELTDTVASLSPDQGVILAGGKRLRAQTDVEALYAALSDPPSDPYQEAPR